MENKNVIISAIIAVAVIFCTILFIPQNNIDLAIKYISRNTLPDGQFIYKNNLSSKVKYDADIYDGAKHAEVLYSMYLLEKYKNNNSLKAQRLKAATYFVSNYIHSYRDMQLVYQKDTVEAEQAFLGDAGMALVALSDLSAKNPSYLTLLEGVGKFIVFMQKPDGSFYHAFNLKKNQYANDVYAYSYPGEAALGLLYLNDRLEDKSWVVTAKKALLYIAEARRIMGKDIPMEQWSVLAVKKLFETRDNTLTDKEHLILQKYVEQMAKATVRKQITDTSDKYYGAFENETRLSNVAIDVEGLIAAYSCTDSQKLKNRIQSSVDLGIKFLSKNQIKNGKYKGGLPLNADWKSSKEEYYSMIRIDVVARALSAWITSETIK